MLQESAGAAKEAVPADLVARKVGANADWNELKRTHELVHPGEEERRRVEGGEDWWKGHDVRMTVMKEIADPDFVPPLPIDRLSGTVTAVLSQARTSLARVLFWLGLLLNPLGSLRCSGEIPRQIASSKSHTVVVTDGGDVYVWGSPESGTSMSQCQCQCVAQ